MSIWGFAGDGLGGRFKPSPEKSMDNILISTMMFSKFDEN